MEQKMRMKRFAVKHGNNVQVRGITPHCEDADNTHFTG